MGRSYKERFVEEMPPITHYKSVGQGCLEETVITVEEMEAIRLADVENLEQTEAADCMDVSSPTFNRIIKSAHHKIAFAFWHGHDIRVAGGNFRLSKCGLCCKQKKCVVKKSKCIEGDFSNGKV